jgi:hypothetical protein
MQNAAHEAADVDELQTDHQAAGSSKAAVLLLKR